MSHVWPQGIHQWLLPWLSSLNPTGLWWGLVQRTKQLMINGKHGARNLLCIDLNVKALQIVLSSAGIFSGLYWDWPMYIVPLYVQVCPVQLLILDPCGGRNCWTSSFCLQIKCFNVCPNFASKCGLRRQKQVSHAGISNCISQYSVWCNYVSPPQIHVSASGTKVVIWAKLQLKLGHGWVIMFRLNHACNYLSMSVSQSIIVIEIGLGCE